MDAEYLFHYLSPEETAALLNKCATLMLPHLGGETYNTVFRIGTYLMKYAKHTENMEFCDGIDNDFIEMCSLNIDLL